MNDRVQPHNLEAERAVIGGIMLENSAADVPLVAENFYAPAHQALWGVVQDLHRTGQPIDTLTVREALTRSGKLESVGGVAYLLGLTNTIPTVANIEAHAKIVRKLASARDLLRACSSVMARGYGNLGNVDAFLDEAEAELTEACGRREDDLVFATMDQVITSTYEGIVARAERGGALRGHSTGIRLLDRMTSGLCDGQLIVVAGRPGTGKTSLAMSFAQTIASVRGAHATLVYSLEMGKDELGERMISSEAEVDGRHIRTGENLHREVWPRMSAAAQRLSALNILVMDKPNVTVEGVLRSAHRERARRGKLSAVVVDYLQLMRTARKFNNREQEVSEMSRSLKVGAKQLGCPVVALSQLNRGNEQRSDKRPMLSDLRESGAIEQDADVVLGIYRDELHNTKSEDAGIAEIIVLKQRHGPTGAVRVKFDKAYTRFRDLEENRAGGMSDVYA